ncbi:hypothetical protein Tco_0048114 [Tanacetum coccineum]
MKRGYAGDIVPLMPAMMAGAVMDQGEGSAQPSEPHHTPVDPISSTSQPPIPSPIPLPSHPSPPLQSPPHSPPLSPHQSPSFSPHRSYKAPLPEGNTSGSAEDSVQLKELMILVPKLVTRINSLEKELKGTKQTLGKAVLKLVKKDIDDDPLVSLVRESMKEKSTDFVTPTKASGEAHEEEISPTILEAAKTLSKVASQGVSKEKSTDKGKRYRRRASKKGQREGKALMVEEDIQATH